MLDFTSSPPRTETRVAHGQWSLRDVLNVLFYYRRIALIVAASVTLLGLVIALAMPARYSAEARLLPLSAGVYDMQDAGGAPQPGQVLDPAAVANVELQMLDSLELHRTLVRQDLGRDATQSDVDTALRRFQSRLHVTKANDANVIELTYTDHDPQRAAEMLRRLIHLYFESRANVLTAGRVTFLEQQRAKIKQQLDRANANITVFQQRNGIVDIAAQVAGAVAQDDVLRKNKLDTDALLADGQRSLSSLRSQARGVPANVQLYNDNTEAARALGEMQAQLLGLQAKRADLASRFMRTAPQVVQVDKQIAALQATIDQQRATLVVTRHTGRNQYFDSTQDKLIQAQASVAGAQARQGELAQQVSASQARLQRLNAINDRLATMKLDRDVLADSFKALSLQVEQARVQLNQASDAGSPNVRVIEAPTPPAERSNPPLLLIMGSLVAGILLAGAAVFVLGSLRDTFLSPVEVERAIDLPVLAAPLEHDMRDPSAHHRDYSRLIAAIDAAGGAASRAVLLVSPNARLSLQAAALGLGRAITRRTPERLLLVRFTADAPVPTSAKEVAIQRFEGMNTAVIGTAACSYQRLDARLIAELKGEYDYVILTAPPLSEGYEGVELAQAADRVLPVIEAETTRKPVLQSLLTQLQDAGAIVLGAILLGRRSHIPPVVYRLLIERKWRG